MDAIEPHWISLLWFAGFATICMVVFLIVAGMFPLRSRPDSARSSTAILLIVGNAALLAALLAGTGLYGYAELRWSTLIVVAGLVVLFAPGLFEVWPTSLRDGKAGLIVLVGVQILALAALVKIGGPAWRACHELVGGLGLARKDQTRAFAAGRPGHGHRLSFPACAWARPHPIRRRIPRLFHDFRDVAVSRGQAG
jgi:hypothetical protein